MAIGIADFWSGASRLRAPITIALIALAASGCSINLGSLTPSSSVTPEPAKLTSSTNIA